MPCDDADLFQLAKLDQARAQPIVDVVVVISDRIGEIGDLCFEARLAFVDEAFAEFAEFACVRQLAMLENAFARLES